MQDHLRTLQIALIPFGLVLITIDAAFPNTFTPSLHLDGLHFLHTGKTDHIAMLTIANTLYIATPHAHQHALPALPTSIQKQFDGE